MEWALGESAGAAGPAGLREVKPFPLESHQLLQVPDALLGDCQLRPSVRFGLLRRFRNVRVCRQEDEHPTGLTLVYSLDLEVPFGDPFRLSSVDSDTWSSRQASEFVSRLRGLSQRGSFYIGEAPLSGTR